MYVHSHFKLTQLKPCPSAYPFTQTVDKLFAWCLRTLTIFSLQRLMFAIMVITSTSSLGPSHGSNANSFGQPIWSTSNAAARSLFGTSTPFGSPIGGSAFSSKHSSPIGSTSGVPGTTKSGGVASTTGIGNQSRGSAVASYSATPELDSRYSAGKIKSISAKPVYQNKSHEELRSEDYELQKETISSVQGNAFQQSTSRTGPYTLPVPSGQSSFGSLSGLESGTVTAALASDSSIKPPFCSTSAVFGVSPSSQFGGSICDGNVDCDPRNFAAGASRTNICGAPDNSKVGFKSAPRSLCSNSEHGSTSSTFVVSNMPSFAPASASSGFKTGVLGVPSASAFEGSSISTFHVSKTPGFGITSTPSSWSTSASFGSILSRNKSTCAVGAPSTSNFAMSTTSEFHFSSTSASGSNRIFAIQTSPGSQVTTTIESTASKQCQGSRVASYSATRAVGRAMNKYSVEKLQSISAMPIYQNKCHEELRLEDYELCNKGSFCFKTSDTPPNNFGCTASSNQSFFSSPFQPFKSNISAPKTGYFITPTNKISAAPTLSPSVNPFSSTNLHPSQSQAFIPPPTAVSSVLTFTPNLNPSSLIPSSELMFANGCQCHKESTTFINLSVGTFSSSKPSVTLQSTSVTALDRWPSILNASHPGQTAEKADTLSNDDLSQPLKASNGLTTVMEFSSQNLNRQEHVPSSTLGVQSSVVVNPFATESPVDQPNAATSRQYGISSLPVSNNLSSNRRTSLMRIRHLSFRRPLLTAQKPSCGSREAKVPFFIDEEDGPGPIPPLLPRENPSAWVKNSMFLRLHSDGEDRKDNGNLTGSTDDTSVQEEDLSAALNRHQDNAAAVTEKHEGDVLAIMPTLPDGKYYTEPSLKELAAKEMAEPGSSSRVNDFLVGRWRYGSIKFPGETDVRHLDLESIIQFKN